MKVDLGTCAVCGAKNSKFVESCYKCGAALPWAPNYVAPTPPEPQPRFTPPAQPAPSPKWASPPAAPPPVEAKTVVAAPLDAGSFGGGNPPAADSVAGRATRPVPIPAWVIGAGVLGCVVLGVLMTMAFGNRGSAVPVATPAAQTPIVVPTPVVVVVPPAASVSPTATPVVNAPVAPEVAVAPTRPEATVPPIQVRPGPSFDEVDTKMDDRGNGWTEAQKQTYWRSVEGTTVRWRGTVVEARLAGGGEISMRCGRETYTTDVQVNLDGSQGQTLGQIGKGESIIIEGILQDHTGSGYTITGGKILSRG